MKEHAGTGARFGTILLWLVTLAFGLAMAGAGATKFTSSASWLGLFAGWGYPPALAYVVGAVEVAAGLALLVPRLATYAAAVVVVIMLAAAVTVVSHPGDMGPVVPLVNVIAFAAVGWLRRGERLGGGTVGS